MAKALLTITELGDDTIKLSGQRVGGCASCSKKQDCNTANLDQQHQLTMVLPRHASAAVGQQVEVDCEEGLLLRALSSLFIPPLLGLCGLPLVLSNFIEPSSMQENILLLSSAIGLALGVFISAKLSRRVATQLKPTAELNQQQQLSYKINT